jgi:hypothetical protein
MFEVSRETEEDVMAATMRGGGIPVLAKSRRRLRGFQKSCSRISQIEPNLISKTK